MAITIRYDANTRGAERNVRSLNREVGRTTRAARNAGTAFSRLGPLIAAAFSVMAAARFARAVTSATDAVTNVTNQLRAAGVATAQLPNNLRAVADLAEQTRTSVEATGGLYARILRSTRELGLSQVEALRVTQTFQESLALSGASTQEAAAASLQFGQALASGRLAGDELRSILENNSFFAQRLAQNLGVGVGALREMGAAGTLTSDTLARVALEIGPEINREFARLNPTFGQLATLIQNEVLEALDQVGNSILSATDDAVGLATAIGETLANAITTAARGVRILITALTQGFQISLAHVNALWTAVSTGAVSAFLLAQNAGALFVSGFISLINIAIDFLVNRLNNIIDLINTAARGLNRLPGVDITQLDQVAATTIAVDFQNGLRQVLEENAADLEKLREERSDAFGNLADAWSMGIDRIVDAVNDTTVVTTFGDDGEVSSEAPPTDTNRIGNIFTRVLSDTLANAILTGDFSNIGNALLASLLKAFGADSFLRKTLDRLFESLAEFLSGLLSKLFSGGSGGGLFSALGGLLGFATGGIVPGPIGAPQLALVHGGERIATPEQQRLNRPESGTGAVNLNLTFNTTGNVDEATQRALRSCSVEISRSVESYLIERGVITI